MEFAIFFLILSIATLIAINLRSGWNHKRLLCHLIITNNYYEKILLLKKIITHDDIAETRRQIKERLGEADYEKVKDIFLNYDLEYLQTAADLNLEEMNVENRRTILKKIKDLLYHKKHTEAMRLLGEINREKSKIDRFF
jgi:hypothetical protein